MSKALLPQDAPRTWIGSASFKLGGGGRENTWQLVCRVDCGTVNFLSVPLSPLILRLEGKQFLHFKLPKVKKQDYTNSFQQVPNQGRNAVYFLNMFLSV